jgi:hypothetical protein
MLSFSGTRRASTKGIWDVPTIWVYVGPDHPGNPSDDWIVVDSVEVEMWRQDKSYRLSTRFTYRSRDSATIAAHEKNKGR